ncbi:MAG TPA: Uma2 family endonuclease [Kofleriaceae bacterium]|jgi:Uma2 family endonuclease|nr:Uma2 family endonuclease [Kofleriaceae bacterium]
MATPKRATYDDVLAAPPHKVAEVINGKLHLFPRPALAHCAAASVLGTELGPPFSRGRGGPGGWIILDEPELHLGEDILVPDLAGWRRERLPAIERAAFMTLAPDWLCEVLSPSTEKVDRAEKLPIYAAAGVRHVWLINPTIRTLEVLRLEEAKWVMLAVHRDDQEFRAEPFEALSLQLATLWADLVPTGGRASEPAAVYVP